MSGDSSRRRDKRSVPFEDIEGEEAFNIAVKQIAPKKATPKRGRGAGSISGGRGSLTGQHVGDNSGQEGKTIPIEVNTTVRLGEIDSSYLVHYPLFPKKRPPTKYDSSLQLEYQSYEGTYVQVILPGKKIHTLSPSMLALTRGSGLCSTIPSTHLCV
jgi:hypothetical protein